MNKSNFKIQPYESSKLDANILSYLNVDSVGHVVTAEAWKALWGFVINGVNRTDAQLHYLLNAEDGIIHTIAQDHVDIKNEHAQISVEHNLLKLQFAKAAANFEQFNKDAEEMRGIHEHVVNTSDALSKAFVHYGEEPPTNPNVRIWVCPTRGVLSPVIGKPTPQHGVVFNDYINNKAGLGSFAAGTNNEATGDYSAAFGSGNKATGKGAFVTGISNIAGKACKVSGSTNNVLGESCFASGYKNNIAEGVKYCAVYGQGNQVLNGTNHLVFGLRNTVQFSGSGAFQCNGVGGYLNAINGGSYNFVLGYSNTIDKGAFVSVFGTGHHLSEDKSWSNSLITGRYSKVYDTTQLLVVGNGNLEEVDTSIISTPEKSVIYYDKNGVPYRGLTEFDPSKTYYAAKRTNAFQVGCNYDGTNPYFVLGDFERTDKAHTIFTTDIENIKTIKDKADKSYVDEELQNLGEQLSAAGGVIAETVTAFDKRVLELEQEVELLKQQIVTLTSQS